MSDLAAPIDLAHETDFAIGPLTVRPSTRQVHRDGATEVLEPRVMQVLVALYRADGGIVSRDDLTRSCWSGRVVGEDAINRVISRLRRTAEGIAQYAFRIETVTKVGYRMLAADAAATATAPRLEPAQQLVSRLPRRWVIAGLGAAGAAAIGAGAWWYGERATTPQVPPGVAPLMSQAYLALTQDTREGHNQAIGLYRQIVAQSPAYADGWGMLSFAYAIAGRYRSTRDAAELRARARAAAARALVLDGGNGYARVGLATARPTVGAWLEVERALRYVLRAQPDSIPMLRQLAETMAAVGRMRESSDLMERIGQLEPPTPDTVFVRIMALWAAGRQEQADALMADAARLYPTHFAVWFARFYVQLFSGRPGASLAMAADHANWPSGIPDNEIGAVARVAEASQSRDPRAIDRVIQEQLASAKLGNGFAENGMQFASLLGRIDDALAIAEAYYLDRGWSMPELRFTPAQGSFLPRGDRFTKILFFPSMAPARGDPRFAQLVGDLGLRRYWQLSGSKADYSG